MTTNDMNNKAAQTPQTPPVRGPQKQARMAAGQGMGSAGAPASRPRPQDAPARSRSMPRTVAIVVAVVAAALLVWLLVWLFACNGPSMFDTSARDGQAPYKTDEEMQAELDRVVEEGMFNISIASVIQFDTGDAPGTAYIENVPGNRYLMKVSITDDESGDVVYESGVLQPNQYIEDITLIHPLEAGMHEATATFTALDSTTYEETGKAAAKVTLNVLA